MTETQSTRPLAWTCTVCGFPVADRAGYLRTNDAEVMRAQRAERERIRGDGPISTTELLGIVDRIVPWQAFHTSCDPNQDAGYGIDIEQLRSYASLLKWTRHLSAKNWLGVTGWMGLMHERAEEGIRRGA